LRKNFKFKEHLIEDFLSSVEQKKIKSILESVTKDNWKDLCIESIRVGKIASYELLLEKKISSLDNIVMFWSEYLDRLENTLASYFATKSVVRAHQIEAVVAYNGLYAVNRVALMYADSIGIQALALSAGSHLEDKFSQISVYRFDSLPVDAIKSKEWEKVRELPMTIDQIDSVKRHLIQLNRAKSNFVYSSPKQGLTAKEIFRKLKLPKNKKIILLTMSSPDEFTAIEAINFRDPIDGLLFQNSYDWLSFVISLVGFRDDVHLILRVHPRQYPNKRESRKSEDATYLEQFLSSLPANVSVNWPSEQISLYDIAKVVDLVLNRTSSAGIELSALGIPTLNCDPELMISYDPNISVVAKTKSEYETAFNNLLEEGRSINHAIKAFRYWGFMFKQVYFDISEGFSYPAAGYLLRKENFTRKLYNEALVLIDRKFRIVERKTIRSKQKLSNKSMLSLAFKMSDDVLIGGVTELRLTEDQERLQIQKVIRELTCGS